MYQISGGATLDNELQRKVIFSITCMLKHFLVIYLLTAKSIIHFLLNINVTRFESLELLYLKQSYVIKLLKMFVEKGIKTVFHKPRLSQLSYHSYQLLLNSISDFFF